MRGVKDPQRDAEIVAAWIMGELQREIGARYGMTQSTVSRVVRRMGAKRAPNSKSQRNARLAADYRCGCTLAELAVRYNIGTGRASVILKKMGARATPEERQERNRRGIERAKAAGIKPGPVPLPFTRDPAYIKMRAYFGAVYARQQFAAELARAA